ncbi:hypothetical protein BVRB_9g225900 [Beta vulgaris subsp. vulgaris]|uniref:Uncharacterized protein n=1 Tax=Beta vulgaris subsp. vulgaris TaxID=3555 RepID=A0A0J8B8P9_BETVV|nr:uncharacterized protein LOC104883301 [Beta vulgaris subsp. vulgaris]KMS96353.1 hypothetical protein BVRB_9g225900 [Beta vulgaris subsp. vulgaris]
MALFNFFKLKLVICVGVLLLATSDTTLARKDAMLFRVPDKEMEARIAIQQLLSSPEKIPMLLKSQAPDARRTHATRLGCTFSIDCPSGFVCYQGLCKPGMMKIE